MLFLVFHAFKCDDRLIDLGGKRALREYYSCAYLDPRSFGRKAHGRKK